MKVHELIAHLSNQEPGREVNLFVCYEGGGHSASNEVWISDHGFMSPTKITNVVEHVDSDSVLLIGEV